MVPRVGQKIGPYEILGRLGSGGMGLVFSAWDSRLQRDVAIKLLREEFATPSMRQRFLQEARAASRLNHANICTIFDIGEQEGDPYLVMELLKGETVRSRITRGGVSAEDLLCVGTEVADALIVAHGRGIIHRDIKPANIILVEKVNGFQTKVLDFGLAKVDDSLDVTKHDLTSAGTTVGTVAYMSPEQAKGEPLDARSDLFSLGVVLYEMATGELPFQGATSALVFVQLLGAKPEPIRDFNPDIPKELDRVIMTCLEKKRTDRYQSASDLVDALRKIVLKKSGGSKSLWGTKPSKGWTRNETPTGPPRRESPPPQPSPVSSNWGVLGKSGDTTTATGAAGTASPESHPSEAFLRPVKRIVTADMQTTPKPESNSAIVPPAASPVRGPASPVPPTASSGLHRPAPTGPPLGSSGTHAPARSPVPVPRPSAEMPISPIVRASDEELEKAIQSASPTARIVARSPVGRFKQADGHEDASKGSSRTLPVHTDTVGVEEKKSGRGGLIAAIVVLLAAVGGGYAWYQSSHAAAPASDVPTSLLLCPLANPTGDADLYGLLNAGLLLDLQESPHVAVHGGGELASALKLAGLGSVTDPTREQARAAAKALGVMSVGVGGIDHDGPSSYVIKIDLYDVASGKEISEVSDTAPNRDRIEDAVDRVSAEVRSALGESGDSIGKTSEPLNREATESLPALSNYWQGMYLLGQGKLNDAMSKFVDAKFTQAYTQLADIDRRQSSEASAADAAASAQNNQAAVGGHTQGMAQASYDINKTGDYLQAIADLQTLCSTYPADIDAHLQLALAQRLAGKFTESLETAQAVLKMDPHNWEAAGYAELAEIALEHPDVADQMERQSRQSGPPHNGIAVLLGFLNGKPVPAQDSTAILDHLTAQMRAAAVKDASGQYADGLALWKSIAADADGETELKSAESYALSHAALDRALADDCNDALDLARQAMLGPYGADALYSSGLASALCKNREVGQKALDTLKATYPKSFAAQNLYIPNLTAVMQWKGGSPAAGVATLQANKQYDELSIAPYLRGLMNLDAKQSREAAADFQEVAQHRGAMSLVTPEVYPLAYRLSR